MTHCTTPAIVLRRREYGDLDMILTVLTRDHGKRTMIAKAAKKSIKRFPGILEPFADLRIVFRIGGSRKGMPVLEEASLVQPFAGIRADIVKTAYASYWAELIALWIEEEQPRPDLHELLCFALGELNGGNLPAALLSVVFQMRFIGHEGLGPVLERCCCCRRAVGEMDQQCFQIDLNKGGIVCNHCPAHPHGGLHLTKGTLKQLAWIAEGPLSKARRVRFGARALAEASEFMEAFVSYHIGRVPNSLSFLKEVAGLKTAAPHKGPNYEDHP